MKQAIGWITVDIAPELPVRQAGYIQQTEAIIEVKDKLEARICRMLDGDENVIWINIDSLGFPVDRFHQLEKLIQHKFGDHVHVLMSATHTHFAGDPKDDIYFDQMCRAIVDGISCIEMQQGTLTYQRHYEEVDLIGKSRITNHEVTTVLDIVSIFLNEHVFVRTIHYNCHPTIMDGTTAFFSHEYPGVLLTLLKEKYPDQNFMFLQGADGDISTRFSRNDQTYDEVLRLSNILFDKVIRMLEHEKERKQITLKYQDGTIALEHQIIDYHNESLEGKSAREIETIQYGRIIQERLKAAFHELPKTLRYSTLSFGGFKYLFFPNELFSEYINDIELETSSLICYSQGYAPYVSGLKEIAISYELFTDTYTKQTKERLKSTLRLESKGVL